MDRNTKILTGFTVSLLGIIFIILGLVYRVNIPAPVLVERSIPSTDSGTLGIDGQQVLVTSAIDGDTIEIEGGQRVRYIGIDTPETVDPRRPVGCFGREASQVNKELVEGKKVVLVKDVSETDKFGRLLRYVYVEDGKNGTIFVNDFLVREGFAKASTFPPDVKFSDQFLQAENEARLNNRGLWNKC